MLHAFFFKCPLLIATGCLKRLFETNVKTSTLYGFRLPLLHLQTLLMTKQQKNKNQIPDCPLEYRVKGQKQPKTVIYVYLQPM